MTISDTGWRDKRAALAQAVGKGLLIVAPWLMKILTFVGTLAMFLVGGGILVHGVPVLHHGIEQWAGQFGGVVELVGPTLANLVLGFIAGGIVLLVVNGINHLRGGASH
ncbi:Inner membrane protein yedI [Cedecea neteri]|uniref:Inner membrane protein yedI n=1 Tax=Cedecea neteri TaxID=158822 RepID=A0A2X3IE72_9ENTR|nr:Inner membrane protein yedI [Cedecea neteri]